MLILDFVCDGPDPAGCSTMFGWEAIDNGNGIVWSEITKEKCSGILKIIIHIYSFHVCAISE